MTELQNRVKKIDESSCDVDVIQAWISHHNAVRNIWKSRKEQCMEVIDTIAEGAGKKTSDIAVSNCILYSLILNVIFNNVE